jgi:hypothetical protein
MFGGRKLAVGSEMVPGDKGVQTEVLSRRFGNKELDGSVLSFIQEDEEVDG